MIKLYIYATFDINVICATFGNPDGVYLSRLSTIIIYFQVEDWVRPLASENSNDSKYYCFRFCNEVIAFYLMITLCNKKKISFV